jgi:hypothetical protein
VGSVSDIYNTATLGTPKNNLIFRQRPATFIPLGSLSEEISETQSSLSFIGPIKEHFSLTKDKSDYLFYVLKNITLTDEKVKISIKNSFDYNFVFWDDTYINSTFSADLDISFKSTVQAKHTLTLVTNN